MDPTSYFRMMNTLRRLVNYIVVDSSLKKLLGIQKKLCRIFLCKNFRGLYLPRSGPLTYFTPLLPTQNTHEDEFINVIFMMTVRGTRRYVIFWGINEIGQFWSFSGLTRRRSNTPNRIWRRSRDNGRSDEWCWSCSTPAGSSSRNNTSNTSNSGSST